MPTISSCGTLSSCTLFAQMATQDEQDESPPEKQVDLPELQLKWQQQAVITIETLLEECKSRLSEFTISMSALQDSTLYSVTKTHQKLNKLRKNVQQVESEIIKTTDASVRGLKM